MWNPNFLFLLSILLGVASGFANLEFFQTTAKLISGIFLNYLSMIAAPIILLSILSTLTNMRGFEQLKTLGRKTLSYTLLTTFFATLVALGVFLALNPVAFAQKGMVAIAQVSQGSYLHFITEIVPSNIVKAFAENKVVSIAFLAFLMGIATHYLPEENRNVLRNAFNALFQLFLKIASLIHYMIPLAVWAFVTLLVQELKSQSTEVQGLWMYLGAVVLANLIQGLLVIPLLLKAKGLSPWSIAKHGSDALWMAFFTKSSNAALPISLKAAKEKLKIAPHVADFTLPLCTVINMNGCAAFILTTVLFVAGVHGHVFTPLDLAFWTGMSVLAAVGNAGVPMGCFFLSSAFLISMNVPLPTMGLILPFYALIDMEETVLNVWSDLSVAAIVDQECKTLPIAEPLGANQ